MFIDLKTKHIELFWSGQTSAEKIGAKPFHRKSVTIYIEVPGKKVIYIGLAYIA